MERIAVNVDPARVSIDDNIRFKILQGRVVDLADTMKADGGMKNPIEIVDMGGGEYLLETGAYRLTAALHAGFKEIPAFVVEAKDEIGRLRSQLSENCQRQDMTLMDAARAVKRAFAVKMTRDEIRKYFARPGGKKGETMVPASNAWVNMVNGLNNLPKNIQESISNGDIGLKACYELMKHPKDEWKTIFNKALELRTAEIERENKEDAKFLALTEKDQNAEKAATDAADKVKEVADALDKHKTALADAEKALKEAKTAAIRASEAKFNIDAKATADEKLAAEAAAKTASKAADAALKLKESLTKKVETLTGKVETTKSTAETRAAKLKELREAVAKPAGKSKPISDADITKAAKATGSESGVVKLSRVEIMKVVADLQLAGAPPNVQAIGKLLEECFNGVITDNALLSRLKKITGEGKKSV